MRLQMNVGAHAHGLATVPRVQQLKSDMVMFLPVSTLCPHSIAKTHSLQHLRLCLTGLVLAAECAPLSHLLLDVRFLDGAAVRKSVVFDGDLYRNVS